MTIFTRFRLRVIFQNMSSYVVLFLGILFANLLLFFGLLLPSVLSHYQEEIQDNLLADYQYILSVPVSMAGGNSLQTAIEMLAFAGGTQTDNPDAEKFSAYSLDTLAEKYKSEEVLLYGVQPDSRYVDADFTKPKYFFDSSIYANRVFDSKGVADPSVEIKFGPNIKDWPKMSALPENMILKVVSEIHDPVTTTDELIPSGETSSYRSNPLGLAEFTLSRKDPAYVGRAKEVRAAQEAVEADKNPVEALTELAPVIDAIHTKYTDITNENIGIGSTIFAVKPGDGSAREQAASCQKVLGGWANIANEYATKRYRSNLINWGMLPFLIEKGDLPFTNGDYIFLPDVRKAVEAKASEFEAYVVKDGSLIPFVLKMGELTDDEREIILKGCLINYNRQ